MAFHLVSSPLGGSLGGASDIAFGPGGNVVAVGNNPSPIATIIHSSDHGVTWTISTNQWDIDTRGLPNSVCWSPTLSLWVAVGSHYDPSYGGSHRYPLVQTSSDGITWTPQTTPWDTSYGHLDSVAWSTSIGLFAAVGFCSGRPGNPRILTSPDGVVWTERSSPFDNSYVNQVISAEPLGLFVVAGYAASPTNIITSNDGITWTAQVTPWNVGAAPTAWGVVWSDDLSLLIATGEADYHVGTVAATSPDGVTWTPRTTPWDGLYEPWAIGLASGGHVLIYQYDYYPAFQLLLSPDGITWQEQSTDVMDNGYINIIKYDSSMGSTWLVGSNWPSTDALATGDPFHTPIVTTGTPTPVGSDNATFYGTVNPSGNVTTAYFEYGIYPSFGHTTTPQSVGSGNASVPVQAHVTGLTPGTLYQVRLVAQD